VLSINYSLVESHECQTEFSTCQAAYAGCTRCILLHCYTFLENTRLTTPWSQDQPPLCRQRTNRKKTTDGPRYCGDAIDGYRDRQTHKLKRPGDLEDHN